MSFSSYQFLLGFLPVLYLVYRLAQYLGGRQTALRVLAAGSVLFYAFFGTTLLAVLMISVVANYLAGQIIMRLGENRRLAGRVLLGAVATNIVALGYLKYTNFFIDIANQLGGSGFSHIHLLVPVGVSFFTFIQIGYLVEAYNGQVERPDFGRYVLFATFLPCVTAGPLVLQREFLEQTKGDDAGANHARRLAVGLTLFAIGLFKKVVLADSIAPHVDAVFGGVALGHGVDVATAWAGALGYALQLYFDFSGYSDMALGLGVMFGIKLPLNFNSPFKATSISEFWRRWHMTMTRFFTNFVYTPLAMRGMRRSLALKSGPVERFLATGAYPAIATFLVAGIWHGAGWTFVVYGLLHGVAIAVNLAWREARMPELPGWAGWLATMSVVVSGLVIFRAPDLSVAGVILCEMWLAPIVPHGGHGELVALDLRMVVALIVVLGSIVLLMPNSQQILHRDWPSSDPKPDAAPFDAGLLSWRPSLGGSLATAAAASVALASIGAGAGFLYYQF
jgi:alginate O-acetyltransferase complex protein AlgI